MTSHAHRTRIVLMALLLCLVSGCVKSTKEGDATVYSMDWWPGALVIVGGLVALGAGGVTFFKSWWKGILLFLVGVIVLVGLAPSMYSDRTVVDAQHFEARYGFWWSPSQFNLRFDDLREMQLHSKTSTGRRGRKSTSYVLHCFSKSGGMQVVSLGDVAGEAAPEIITRARAAGVAFSDHTSH